MVESKLNEDVTVKIKEQDVDTNRKDEINKENSTGMVNNEHVGLTNVENLKISGTEVSLSDFQTMYSIDLNDFDCHEPFEIDQPSPVNMPSTRNVKDCFKQLTNEQMKKLNNKSVKQKT
ncbi:hypothetical protein DPMN_071214 [Dreissena polymorpha]|uniref:Uncharacterized protein n=1 Tax=Dreissena polymorpha TaxID=45954 RepID=A0A9D4BVL1_DREPO|nr:hypothetical protein DPMN_071214 [Dreissena polymorpha]